MKTIAIAGCGKLGNIVADAILNGILPEYELTGVYSRTLGSAQALAEKMVKAGKECRVAEQFEQLRALKPDYLIEAASPAAMREWALPTLKQGISIITLSIGAFADDAFYAEVMQTAKAYGAQVYVVSGATGGFDVLQTAALMGGATAQFFNEKGPDALRGNERAIARLYMACHGWHGKRTDGEVQAASWHEGCHVPRHRHRRSGIRLVV